MKISNSLGHLHIDYPYDLAYDFLNSEDVPIVAFKIHRHNQQFLNQNTMSSDELFTSEEDADSVTGMSENIKEEIENNLLFSIRPNPAVFI